MGVLEAEPETRVLAQVVGRGHSQEKEGEALGAGKAEQGGGLSLTPWDQEHEQHFRANPAQRQRDPPVGHPHQSLATSHLQRAGWDTAPLGIQGKKALQPG